MPIFLFLLFLIPGPQPADSLIDFSRLARAQGAQISLTDLEGLVLEGTLTSAGADALTMEFGNRQRVFTKDSIASADRVPDRAIDGLIKGALFGVLLGFVAASEPGDRTDFVCPFLMSSAIGWWIDDAKRNREPIYRASPKTLQPAVRLSLRF